MKSSKSKKSSVSADRAPAVMTEPTLDEVAALAHRYWEEAGCPHGCDLDHWLRAENELRQQRQRSERS